MSQVTCRSLLGLVSWYLISHVKSLKLIKGRVLIDESEWGGNPGPRFNIKMSSYRYRKSHCGDKTVVRSSYLHNGISYTGKMTSFHWIRAQVMSLYVAGLHHDAVNSSPLGQNGRHFTEDIFRCIFVNEKFYILIKISLTFIPKGQIGNNPALN